MLCCAKTGLSLSSRLAQQWCMCVRLCYPSDAGQARATSLSQIRNSCRLISVQTIPNGNLYNSQSCHLKSKKNYLQDFYSHFIGEWPQAEATHWSWPCTGSLWGLAHMAKFTAGRCGNKLYVGRGSWFSSSGTWQLQALPSILQIILLRHIYHLQVCPKI